MIKQEGIVAWVLKPSIVGLTRNSEEMLKRLLFNLKLTVD